MLIKDKKNYSQSLTHENSKPCSPKRLPFLEYKKSGAQAYVSERLNKIRKQKSREKYYISEDHEVMISQPKSNINNYSHSVSKKWGEFEQPNQSKRRNVYIASNNKVINNQVLSFEPFRKQLEMLKKKPNININYDQLLSNLHPFSNAISDLGVYKLDQERNRAKRMKVQSSPGSVNLYRSIPKKKPNKSSKPSSQSHIKSDEAYFLNVNRINLLDAQSKALKKQSEHSSLIPDRRFSVLSLDQEDRVEKNEEVLCFERKFSRFPPSSSKCIDEQSYGKFLSLDEKQPNVDTKLPLIQSKDTIVYIQASSTPTPQLYIPVKKRKKELSSLPFETYYYRSFIWKVNNSNSFNVETPQQYEHRLRVYIGKGNNSSLVRGLIKRRIWFAVTDRIEEANFVWTQLKSLPYFKLQSEGSVHSAHPVGVQDSNYASTFLTKADQKEFKKYLNLYIESESRTDEKLLSRNKYFKYSRSIKAGEIRMLKMQNHLINNYVIGNKKALFQTMSAYYANESKEEVFDFLPLTFHIREGLEDSIYYKFLKYYYQRAKDIRANNLKQKNIWIVKPGENSNRGNGIKVCLTLEEIKTILKKKQFYSDGTCRTYIVQSYIQRPLLYNKRKFDIRHYMMITCVNGIVKGYWYKEGYVRTTSTEYSLGTNCSKIHLTNDAVQKNLPDYGKYEKGNKLSYQQLDSYIAKLTEKRKDPVSFKRDLLPKMKKIATDSIRACSGTIDPERRENNFEVFGLDFMIDAHYKLYLIEVNSNPCLELSCPLLGSIIPRMVENALEMTLDAMFPPPVRYSPKGMHYFKNLEQQNKYELVYDSRFEKIYKCSMVAIDDKLLEEEDDTFQDDGDQYDADD